MTQVHVVFRRINPALKIDLAQVGHVDNGQFANLPISIFEDTVLPVFLKSDSISDSHYIYHSDIASVVAHLSCLPGFAVEYFDNTLVLMFNFNLDCNESAPKEEGERN